MPSIISATTTNGVTVTGDNSGSLQLATNNGTTAVTIDTSQRVLIGATSASGFDSGADNLIVGAGSGSNGITIYSGNTSTAAINFADGTTGSDIYAGGITYNHNTNNLDLATTDGSTRMRITSAGLLFVNTTSLIGDGYVSVSFNGSSNVGMGLKSTHNGSFDVMRFVNYNNVQQGYINCNNSGSTTYNSGSDYRFKDNVQPMTNGLSKVMQLKPVTFNWKGDNSAGQGFIAHELAEIVPDIVSGEKDAVTEDGTIKPQGVDYGKLTAVLTSAIQELKAELDATKAEVQALKGTL